MGNDDILADLKLFREHSPSFASATAQSKSKVRLCLTLMVITGIQNVLIYKYKKSVILVFCSIWFSLVSCVPSVL